MLTDAPLWYVTENHEVPSMRASIPSAAFQWIEYGSEEYPVTDQITFEIPGRVEIDSHVNLNTN